MVSVCEGLLNKKPLRIRLRGFAFKNTIYSKNAKKYVKFWFYTQ